MAPALEASKVSAPSRSRPDGTRDGSDLAVSLLSTLLELGLTLTASYFLSKWLANKIRGDAGPGAGDAEFMADNGTGSGGSVVDRLERLLVGRHEATVRAMMEELDDHRAGQEEKKEESHASDDEEGRLRTERQYERLQKELHLQHQDSLSTLNTLTPYETSIAQGNVIDPSNITVTFADVGGMDDVKSEIYDLVVLPLLRPDLFMSDSGLVSPPKGILLYGPPGTGKTMLAKAIAKESHATFVNVQLSTIMNKWFGESNKLISATFQLARKLAPSVVFIDEMDAFLSQRDGTEGSAVNSMKSEFLTLWDGLLSERKGKRINADDDGGNGWFGGKKDATQELDDDEPLLLPTPPIIVLGATNRPYDVDPAILRRLPRSFEIPLPPLTSRLQLLELFLQKQSMTKAAKDFLPTVAKKTEGYSGSDLKEVCRAAAWEPVREMTTGASRRASGCVGGRRTASGFPPRGTKARPVNADDFLLAIRKVKKTGESARQFAKKEILRGREQRAATAEEIKRESGGSESGSKASSGQAVNLDIQQLMAMANAMAVAASATDKNTPRLAPISGDDNECDDSPPDMSG